MTDAVDEAVGTAAEAHNGLERGDFSPHPWLRGFHRMTLAGVFARFDKRKPLPPVEERLFRVDDETTVLALCSWQASAPAPTLVLVHGFAGDAGRPYMLGTTRKAFAAGYHVVRVNARNCGGTEHMAGTLYHAGLVSDLRAVVGELQGDERCARFYLAGFSMGGNIVLRLAGLWGERAPPQVAGIVAVSPSIDLDSCASVLDGLPALSVYRNSFLRRLKATYRRRASLFPARYDEREMRGVQTLRQFDEVATAPDCGFGDSATYYAQASARPLIGQVAVPSLVLHSQDDIMVPWDAEQVEALRIAPAIRLVLTDRGGHNGFIEGRARRPGQDRYWAENRLVRFLDELESGARADLGAP
jgi:predicted alpha/beta-fold hydrolase